MAWRPSRYLIAGLLDNRQPGKVVGWLRFAGVDAPILLNLDGDFHQDIRGTIVHLIGEADDAESSASNDVCGYMDGFDTVQTGAVGDMTAGREPVDYGSSPYFEWYSKTNGRVVLELSPKQVHVVGNC